jgi:hypothetical protein
MHEGYTGFASAEAGETGAMTEQRTNEENVEQEVELDEQNGELLPDREVMSVLDPSGASTGNLGPPVPDEIE